MRNIWIRSCSPLAALEENAALSRERLASLRSGEPGAQDQCPCGARLSAAIAILKELHRCFEALYSKRLVRMVLFGSQARGDAVPGSDIDVLVVLQGPVDPGGEIARTGEQTASLSLEHDVVISRVFVSADQFSDERSPLILNVRREGIAV